MNFARGALHVTRAIAASVAVVVVFVVALVAGVVLHLGAAPVRRVVARELPVLLDGAFPGKLRVHALGGLSVQGLGGVDVDLVHPDGEVVARLRDVEVTLDPVRAVKAFLGSGPIEIPIRSVKVDALDLDVTMKDGNLRIADVFVDPTAPTEPDEPGSRALEVNIRDIAIRHAWAHGRIEADGPVVDVDLDDLRAVFALDDTTTRVGLTRVDLVTRRLPRGADVRARLSAGFDMTSEPDETHPAQSAFYFLHGTVARSPIQSSGILHGDEVHAWVGLPEVTPAQIRDVAPEAPPIADPVNLTASVAGTFDHLTGRVLAAAGKTRLDVAADAVLAPSLSANARVHADDLDAALVGGPSSSVSLDLEASVELPEGGEPKGRASLTTAPGVVAGIPVPAVAGRGTFAGESGHAEIDVREPGLRTAIVADLKPGPHGSIVDATVDVPRADLTALKRRGFEAKGTAEVHGKAHLDLGAELVEASLRLSAGNLSAAKAPGVSVGSLTLDAHAKGALANPYVKANALARGVALDRRDVRWATVAVDGPAMQPLVVAEVSSLDFPAVRARARVDVRGGPTLEDIQVEAKRGTTTAKLAVARVVLGSGLPTIRDARIDGLGETMHVSVTPEGARGTHLVAQAPQISIPAVSELAALDVGLHEGRVAIDADVTLGDARIDGKIRVDLQNVDVQRGEVALNDMDLSVLAEMRGKEVRFSIDSESAAVGSLHVRSTRTVELAGPPGEVTSWRNAVGALRIDGDVRLASVARLLPREMLPVQDVEGRLVVRGEVVREEKGRAPGLDLTVETRELAVIGKPASAKTAPVRPAPLASYQPSDRRQSREPSFTPNTAQPPAHHGNKPDPTPVPAFTVRNIDLTLHAVARPDPARVELTVKARDAHGDLVAVAIGSDFAYGGVIAGEPLDMAQIENTPLSAKVSIPSRKIADLPPTLGIPSTPGNVVLDVALDGTLKQPKVTVDGALVQLSIEDSPLEQPFAVKVKADYDGERANAHVALDQGDARLLKATGAGSVKLRDLLHPKDGEELPWNASADVRLGPLPLDVLEAVLPTKIDGIASGHVKIDDLHRNASVDADVSVAGLVLGGIPHKEASVKVVAKDGKLTGKLRMAQPDGSLDADARVGIAWGERIVPELRASDDFDVGVRARSFRLRAVEPFLTSVVNRLDGRLDGDVRLSKEALTDAAKGRGVKGKLALRSGSLEVAAGGGPLEGVRATVRVDEQGMVRLEDVFARGARGEVRAVGVASFGDSGFRAARLNVVIPEKKPMPLLLSGEHLADVSANVKVSADMVDGGKELRVGVDIPRLQVELPDSLPDGVQQLDDIEQVRIGTMRRGRFIPLAVDAPDPVAEASGSGFRTRLNIALRNARILKGDMLSTYVRGNPSLLIDGDKTVMSGSVKLAGGRVDIKGRRFEIESGTITFTGDPANPDVLLTAKWKAPDDTWIYADFVGPLATGKVNLRSDPPRSREEILALVIFGRAEGYSSGGQEADKGTQAVGMAGGFATEGLNKVLDDVTDLEIRTRVDTSSSTNPRPELEVQISQAIAARIAYVLGELAPGQSPDRTYATLDWNFRPEWSLETTVGDKQSTTVDMIWERRY